MNDPTRDVLDVNNPPATMRSTVERLGIARRTLLSPNPEDRLVAQDMLRDVERDLYDQISRLTRLREGLGLHSVSMAADGLRHESESVRAEAARISGVTGADL